MVYGKTSPVAGWLEDTEYQMTCHSADEVVFELQHSRDDLIVHQGLPLPFIHWRSGRQVVETPLREPLIATKETADIFEITTGLALPADGFAKLDPHTKGLFVGGSFITLVMVTFWGTILV
jgi:hypothetical protein